MSRSEGHKWMDVVRSEISRHGGFGVIACECGVVCISIPNGKCSVADTARFVALALVSTESMLAFVAGEQGVPIEDLKAEVDAWRDRLEKKRVKSTVIYQDGGRGSQETQG